MAPATLSRMGPYEVVETIGAGAMGEVYRARDTRLGRAVAVKVIRGAAAADPDRLRRFELEARAASVLNHPNIVAIYDVGTHEGVPFLVSELLEGETLRTRLLRGPLPPSKVLECAVQVAEGLAAAHARGIVHRDVKPENIFLCKDGRVKVLDFGLAKLAEPSKLFGDLRDASTVDSGTGHFVGTVAYMAPEQARGQQVDHRADIFAFGAVLYEMVTGRRAFQRGSALDTVTAILHQDPPDLMELDVRPPGLKLILQHCLEKEPDRRFQSATDLAFHLTALSMESGSAARLGTLAPPRARGVSRLAAAAAALVVLGAVGAAAYLAGRSAEDASPPLFRQLTYRRGSILSARFAPDGHTIVYGAAWDGGPATLFSTRPESPESTRLGLPEGDILAISRSGEMAVCLGRRHVMHGIIRGTLARVALAGGAPREVATDVEAADWSPDGRDLAIVRVEQGRYRLEYPIGTLLYETGGWISRPRVSPDGQRVAFIDHPFYRDDRGAIVTVDTQRRRTVLADGWSSANGLAWTPSGEVWFTAAAVGSNTALHAVRAGEVARVIARPPGRLTLHDVHADGRVLLSETRYRLRIGKVEPGGDESDLSWLDGSVVTDLSDDGGSVLFVETGTGAGVGSYAVYRRTTDGAPAVRLGEGSVPTLSPDGRWVACVALAGAPAVAILPTGAGQARMLARGPMASYEAVAWLPDGRRILFAGSERGRAVRLYVQAIDDAAPRPIAPEGLRIVVGTRPVSPDGRRVAAVAENGSVALIPIDGGEPAPLRGVEPGEIPVRWSGDGAAIYLVRTGAIPAAVHRLRLSDGRREMLAQLSPFDRAGVNALTTAQTTPEARVFVYSYVQSLADLHLVEGLPVR